MSAQYPAATIAEALVKTRGNVTAAARAIGCNRETVRRAVDRFDTCREAVERGREERVDVAETALDKALDAGEPWAVALTLKTIGKARGYTERSEQVITDTRETVRVVFRLPEVGDAE